MREKIRGLNRGLRLLFMITGGLFALIKLTEKKRSAAEEGEDGYQTREFDDIW